MDAIAIKELPNKKVMYVETKMVPNGISATFHELESKLPSLKQRKFYGVMFSNKYWAAVEMTEQDNPEILGLKIAEIPGGKYACKKIKNWNQDSLAIDIPQAFKEITEGRSLDKTRPFVEFYQSRQELILLAPINQE